jgi:hypothetical protein
MPGNKKAMLLVEAWGRCYRAARLASQKTEVVSWAVRGRQSLRMTPGLGVYPVL